jgi:hypothetical protein
MIEKQVMYNLLTPAAMSKLENNNGDATKITKSKSCLSFSLSSLYYKKKKTKKEALVVLLIEERKSRQASLSGFKSKLGIGAIGATPCGIGATSATRNRMITGSAASSSWDVAPSCIHIGTAASSG